MPHLRQQAATSSSKLAAAAIDMMSARGTPTSSTVRSPKWSRLRSICRSSGDNSRGARRSDRRLVLGLVDRFLDLVAKRRLSVLTEEQTTQSRATNRQLLSPPPLLDRLACRYRSALISGIGVGDAEACQRSCTSSASMAGGAVISPLMIIALAEGGVPWTIRCAACAIEEIPPSSWPPPRTRRGASTMSPSITSATVPVVALRAARVPATMGKDSTLVGLSLLR